MAHIVGTRDFSDDFFFLAHDFCFFSVAVGRKGLVYNAKLVLHRGEKLPRQLGAGRNVIEVFDSDVHFPPRGVLFIRSILRSLASL